MDERYAVPADPRYNMTGSTLQNIGRVSTNSPPAAPLLQVIGAELAMNVKELHELVAQARGIADSILGSQPEPGDPKETNGAAGSFGAISMEVAALRHVTRSLREQLNRLAAL